MNTARRNLIFQKSENVFVADRGLLEKKLAWQHDKFRPGDEYRATCGCKVDADETAIYKP
jgi:hypothetical protein